MSRSGAAARGAAATVLGQAGKVVIQVASVAVLARALSAADFGTISMALALIGFAGVLGDFGLSMAAIQASSLTKGQRSNLFWLNLAIGAALAAAIYALSWPIAMFYGRDDLTPVVQALAALYLINAATAQFRAEVTRRSRFGWMAAVDVLAPASALAVALIVAATGAGYWALVAQQLALVTMTLVLLIPASGWLPGLPSRRAPMKDLLRFGANTTGVQLIGYASANVDSILLGRFWGSTVLGFYDRAYQIFRMPLEQLAAPMTRVALPVLARIEDDATFDRYVKRAQLILTYLVGGTLLSAVALSDPLVDVLLGPGWDPSKGLFVVLAIGGVFQALGYVYYWIFVAKALTGLQLRYTVITRSLMIALIAVGTIGGAYGVAAATATGLFVNWLVLTLFAVPRTGVDVRGLVALTVRPVLMYSVMIAVVLPASLLLGDTLEPIVKLAALGAVMIVVLSLWILVWAPARQDLRLLLDTVRMLRRRGGAGDA